MAWETILERLAFNAANIVSIATLISLIVRYFFLKPMEKRRAKEEEEKMREQREFYEKIINDFQIKQQPIYDAIDKLNDLLEESTVDRQNLHKIIDTIVVQQGEHDATIDDHEKRIIRLEIYQGDKLKYKEKYE